MIKAPAIGIDLGTSFSCCGVCQTDKIEIIPNDYGERKIPSLVTFTNKRRLFENEAKDNIFSNERNTIFNIKRIIGYDYNDSRVKNKAKLWPFKIVKDLNSNRPQVQVTYKNQIKKFYAEEILAMELQKLKENATKFLGKEVKDAVLTVPNYFTYSQRQSIKDAGTIAGLNVIRLINESTAVALAYGCCKKKREKRRKYCYIWIRGGNLNVSVLTLEDDFYEVKSINGNVELGGEDFDNKLIEYCINDFRTKKSIDVRRNPKALLK